MTEEVKKNIYDLTEEDNKKIIQSFTEKADKIAELTQIIASMTEVNKECVGLQIENHARDFPEKTAILYEDIKINFKEYNEHANQYANFFLNKVGLKKGDVVIVLVENRPELLYIIIALSKIGMISSLINTNQRKSPLVHSITHSEGKNFIIGEELLDAFEEVKAELDLSKEQSDNLYFLADKGDKGEPEGYKNLKKLLLNEDKKNPPTTTEILSSDPYAYIFTSGTTGLPKAAIMTNAHTLGAMRALGMIVCDMKPEDVMYITTPLYHSNAILVAFAPALYSASAIAIRRKFSASEFWSDTRKYGATIFNYVGEICRYLYNQPPKPDDSDNPIYKIIGNGLRNDIWKDFKKRFGIEKVFEFYGATEMNIPSFFNIHNLDCTVGTCLVPYAIVKYDIDKGEPIKDENGFMQKIEKGGTGLLLGAVADQEKYYMYKDKNATNKKAFRNVFEEGDLWVNTGDLLRDIGYNHAQFVDRLGDTFRWKGENVSTEEVETVINTHHQIEMCSVYGVLIPNTEGRAGMVSIISSSAENFDFKALLDIVKKYLPHYAIPCFYRFKKDLEFTGTLKIKKSKLKSEGFNIEKFDELVYVLLPGASDFTKLDQEVFSKINTNQYRF